MQGIKNVVCGRADAFVPRATIHFNYGPRSQGMFERYRETWCLLTCSARAAGAGATFPSDDDARRCRCDVRCVRGGEREQSSDSHASQKKRDPSTPLRAGSGAPAPGHPGIVILLTKTRRVRLLSTAVFPRKSRSKPDEACTRGRRFGSGSDAFAPVLRTKSAAACDPA